jgi:hypothetical protein
LFDALVSDPAPGARHVFKPLVEGGHMPSGFHPRMQGDQGEAIAIQWLVSLGACVCFPLFHSPDYDLVADLGNGVVRIQVKTSSRRSGSGWQVRLSTSGGNRSWTGTVKSFDPRRCEFVFVAVADGGRWFIPSHAIEGRISINVGAPKYEEYRVVSDDAAAFGRRDLQLRGRGSAGGGEPGSAVNRVPRAEWVRIPPPPSTAGRTRISPGHQVTIPAGPFREASLSAGDRLEVEATGPGEVRLTRVDEAIAGQLAMLPDSSS